MLDQYWKKLKKKKSEPKFFSGVEEVNSKKFFYDFNNLKNIKRYIDILYKGKFLLIKNIYTKKQIENIKSKVLKIEKNQKQSFHRLKRKTPNFWRNITPTLSKKYSLKTDRTSWYFFRWNKSSRYYFNLFDDLWKKIKLLQGLEENIWVNSLPNDKDHIDRIQIVRYAEGSGFIEPHRHPTKNLIMLGISVYLSQINKDYSGGGTYFYNKNKKKIFVENRIEAGDVGIFYASLYHGVDATNPTKKLFSKKNGRWWCGLYSPESDLKNKRLTSTKAKI